MNKADLTDALAAKANIPKVRAAQYINILTNTIREALVSGEKVTISDFGTFTVSQRREFTGHNPKNGKEIIVPSGKRLFDQLHTQTNEMRRKLGIKCGGPTCVRINDDRSAGRATPYGFQPRHILVTAAELYLEKRARGVFAGRRLHAVGCVE